MNNYAKVRIIIWSIIAVICLGALCAGLYGNWAPFSFRKLTFGKWRGYAYSNSDKYTVGGGSVNARDIQSIEINWTAGSVDVVSYDGDAIQFNEAGYNGADDNYAMRYLAENGKLIIMFTAPQRNWRFLRRLQKSLTVKIPHDLPLRDIKLNSVSADIRLEGARADDLYIHSVSGSMDIKDINGGAMILENVSGRIYAEDLSISTLRANTVSGRIGIEANVESANLKTVSGAVKLHTGEGVKKIDAKTVSGDITLGFPENDGFTARYSSVSGRFECEFPVEMSGKSGVYRNGDRDISLKTVSGNIKILRN
jgi:DUF4097 and DUF4098 domain-containing protein YvlB